MGLVILSIVIMGLVLFISPVCCTGGVCFLCKGGMFYAQRGAVSETKGNKKAESSAFYCFISNQKTIFIFSASTLSNLITQILVKGREVEKINSSNKPLATPNLTVNVSP